MKHTIDEHGHRRPLHAALVLALVPLALQLLATPTALAQSQPASAPAAVPVRGVRIVPSAQVQPATIVQPAQPAQSVQPAPAVGSPAQPGVLPQPTKTLSVEEKADLERELAQASPEDRAALLAAARALYAAAGIDLDLVLRGGPSIGPDGAVAVGMTLQQAVVAMDFSRTPQSVLAARSKLALGGGGGGGGGGSGGGSGVSGGDEGTANDGGMNTDPPTERPPLTDHPKLAQWLHLQVMAGEWSNVRDLLAAIDENEAKAIYGHILQSLNRPPRNDPSRPPDPALLPEDIVALADASRGPLLEYQIDVLAGLLKNAATKYGTEPMLELIAEGGVAFGKADDAQRERTVRFLVGAGLVVPAAAYFPPLDAARAARDAKALLNHGRYHEAFAARRAGSADADVHRRTAWDLYAEATLLDGADGPSRQEALRRAIDLLPQIPPAPASAWLKSVFASRALAPAALEVIALKAVSLRNASLDEAQRARTILVMKESIDTLLAQSGLDPTVLRVPLRMLTTSLVAEAELAVDGGDARRRGPTMPQELELLLRALPDERWIAALEPSIASRAYRAAIGVATACDEIDVALEYLGHAARRFPQQAMEFADGFLVRWEGRLTQPSFDPNEGMYFIGFVRDAMGSAPLTRGRQRRNLDRLADLMATLDSLGVDSRSLPSVALVFNACHGRTEVFTKEGIEAVFGPIADIPPQTAVGLADQMRQGLSGDWRDRRAQQAAGMKRSAKEITEMVERGYALAIDLVDRAIAAQPSSWRFAVVKAGLTYDRVQWKQAEERQDFAVYNQFRKEAFEAFAATAERYAARVAGGEERDDASVYLAWFNAAVGSTELNYLTRDDLLVEGSPQDDQIDLIGRALAALSADAKERHIGLFARAITDALPGVPPDVKPRIVRHALRIVGDHPAGAALRRLGDLHRDLVKDEIKLRFAVDGDDRIGADRRFGATLTLRCTAAVDRETGGFSRYLQNDVWARVGNTYRPMNYRDQLKKSIESALGENFIVDGIGFFEALAPPKPVREAGEEGWLEKPIAYVVLQAKDPSIDRLPAISMDLHFNDTAGPVVLPILSNAPPIDAASEPGVRPTRSLKVVQVLDLRGIDASDSERAVTLEITARGDGVLPELDDLLEGVRTALPGYDVAEDGIETRPINLLAEDAPSANRFFMAAPEKAKDYIEPDEAGFYRLPTERSWVVTYTPASGSVGDAFTLPTLRAGLDGTLASKQFADMDLVEVTSATVAVERSRSASMIAVLAALVATMSGLAVVLWSRRRTAPAAGVADRVPHRLSPLSVIAALRRLERDAAAELSEERRAALQTEIAELERRYFGPLSDGAPSEVGTPDRTLEASVDRWLRAAV